MATDTPQTRWSLDGAQGIVWMAASDGRLPHEDHVEMSGRKVSLIVRYRLDNAGRLSLLREVIWPTLRIRQNDVRGYLIRKYDDGNAPRLRVNGVERALPPVERVRFDGFLTFEHRADAGIGIQRTLFPAHKEAAVLEQWSVRNVGNDALRLEVDSSRTRETDHGVYGEYRIETFPSGPRAHTLAPGDAVQFGTVFRALKADESRSDLDMGAEAAKRAAFLDSVRASLQLETPEPVLDTAFGLARIRAAESVFDTKLGLMHSPGGGRYYGGVWANDQAEYAGPFFPFLGEPAANAASLNAYRIFSRAANPQFRPIPSSFEVEGDVAWAHGDRGDAAMVAYGAARFALATGDRATAEELWPLIAWCLEYCRRKTNAAGVVESDCDELEKRFPAGSANLSTSALAYGAMRSAADLAVALDLPGQASELMGRAEALRAAIERFFGAEMEGFRTYRYYEGNTTLRAWICLPLTMGITERGEGTVAALFSPRLWTVNGVATEEGHEDFWDRGTLYSLRGALVAGAAAAAMKHLIAYTRQRLLGDHVPYPVEAYPEGGQAHLAAESALYCRVFIEGLFGVVPTGLRAFRCMPRLPEGWPFMRLRNVRAFGRCFDLQVTRRSGETALRVEEGGTTVFAGRQPPGTEFAIELPPPSGMTPDLHP